MSASPNEAKFALAIHCGAGNITPETVPPDQEQESCSVMERVLEVGHSLLRSGGHSLDVVEAVVRQLEDYTMFNAGKGACFTHDGRNELDASIMDGRTLRAGAVAGVTTIRNPISAARAVMERSPYVLLIGRGAEEFAGEHGLDIVDPSYFFTKRQYEKLEKMRREELTHSEEKLGTVGAVALDSYGNLAAATSTGGMMNKRYGRVGDSPVIGAGTYANNATCAVSATGIGEDFLCNVVSYDIAALIEYKGLSLSDATQEVMRKLSERKGEGGVIAIDKNGHIAMPFISAGMYRGYIKADGQPDVQIFR